MNQILPITLFEKIITFINAKLTAIGITVGSIATAFWYMTSSVSSGGLGLAIGGTTAAITSITLVGAASLFLAIPIAYLSYRDLIAEAEAFNQEIDTIFLNYEKNQDRLFFDLLRFRHICKDSKIFFKQISRFLNNNKEIINLEVLTGLINQVYEELRNKRFIFSWNSSIHSNTFSHIFNDPQLTLNPDVRNKMINYIHRHYHDSLLNCYHPINTPHSIKRGKAATYGIIAGLTITGITLGTGWTFPAMVIGIGLSASIPFIGWAILGISCIALGIIFGIGVGICKQKNLQREAIKLQVKKHYHALIQTRGHVNNTLLRIATQQSSMSNVSQHCQTSTHKTFNTRSVAKYGLLHALSSSPKQMAETPIKINPSP